MMKIDIVSVACGGPGTEVGFPVRYFDNTKNLVSPCRAYQRLLLDSESEFIAYVHDDVTVHDTNWLDSIENLFDQRPNCVVVGLGGATGLGHPDIYKKPYDIRQMARRGYVSNQTDCQTHGGLEKGEKQVAVVDAFFLAVRTAWLKQIGGWPVDHLSHHCLDLWICLEAARRGKEVWMVGAECTHHGGGTSTKPVYEQAAWLQGGSLASDHGEPHRWLYAEYRDVLPLRVNP